MISGLGCEPIILQLAPSADVLNLVSEDVGQYVAILLTDGAIARGDISGLERLVEDLERGGAAVAAAWVPDVFC